MQYLKIGDSDWDETNFVGKRKTRAIPTKGG
jgi:hypothetical protein